MQETSSVVFIHPKTGKVGLQLRSAKVNEPNTWAGVGGYVEVGEHPQRAAYREIEEELGIDLRNHPLRMVSHKYPHTLYRMEVPVMFQPKLNWESDGFAWKHPSEWRRTENIHPELIETLFNKVFGAEEPHSVDKWGGDNKYCWTIPKDVWMEDVKNCLRFYNTLDRMVAHTHHTPLPPWSASYIGEGKPNPTYVREIQCRYGEYRLGLDLLMIYSGINNRGNYAENPISTKETIIKRIIKKWFDDAKDGGAEGAQYLWRRCVFQILNFISYSQGLLQKDAPLWEGGLVYNTNTPYRFNNVEKESLNETNKKLFDEILDSFIFRNACSGYQRAFMPTYIPESPDPIPNENIAEEISGEYMNKLLYWLCTGINPKNMSMDKIGEINIDFDVDGITLLREMQRVPLIKEDAIKNAFIYQECYLIQQKNSYGTLGAPMVERGKNIDAEPKQQYLLNNTKIGNPINPLIPDAENLYHYSQHNPANKKRFGRMNLDMYEYADPELYYYLLRSRTDHRGWNHLQIYYEDRAKLWRRPRSLQLCAGGNVLTEGALNYNDALIGLQKVLPMRHEGIIYSGEGPIPEKILNRILTYQGTTWEDYSRIREEINPEAFDEQGEVIRRGAWGKPEMIIDFSEEEENWILLESRLEDEALMHNTQGVCQHPMGKNMTCGEPVIVYTNRDLSSNGIKFEDEYYCDEHTTGSTEVEGYGEVDFGENVPTIYADDYANEYVRDYY